MVPQMPPRLPLLVGDGKDATNTYFAMASCNVLFSLDERRLCDATGPYLKPMLHAGKFHGKRNRQKPPALQIRIRSFWVGRFEVARTRLKSCSGPQVLFFMTANLPHKAQSRPTTRQTTIAIQPTPASLSLTTQRWQHASGLQQNRN